jgi:hypothetical protein
LGLPRGRSPGTRRRPRGSRSEPAGRPHGPSARAARRGPRTPPRPRHHPDSGRTGEAARRRTTGPGRHRGTARPSPRRSGCVARRSRSWPSLALVLPFRVAATVSHSRIPGNSESIMVSVSQVESRPMAGWRGHTIGPIPWQAGGPYKTGGRSGKIGADFPSPFRGQRGEMHCGLPSAVAEANAHLIAPK